MAVDPHSHARPDVARVRHVSLDLSADFAARRLSGRVALTLEVAPGAAEVVLDTRGIAIREVADGTGRALEYTLGAEDAGFPLMGRALTVALPEGASCVVVDYETGPDADALQWLVPEQTAGGAHPFLFTQGHAILTRSWLPTQDSPGVRQTYDARITVPDGLVAVMSAERLNEGGEAVEGGRCFAFRMREPIPPYLIALAVGDLASRPLGPRTGVLAEPAVVEAARAEFRDLERMMEAAEAIGGAYRWGRLDVLVMPPSFPYGGMENPRLTFLTPTLIAGDRSLTTLVAHELAHAWAGNLVTHATWSDFWLNEGFTVYMELRIMEALYGPERAAMLEVYGRRALAEEMALLGPSSPDTRLVPDYAGRDPAIAVGTVPYVKGAALLRAIEELVGRERFDAWLRAWFDGHAFRSATTDDFARAVREGLLAGDAALEARLGLAEWLYAPGMPAGAPAPASAALDAVDAAAAAVAGGAPASTITTAAWTPQEWRHFLMSLPATLGPGRLAELDAAFGLSQATNAEILFAWLRLAVRARHEPALPALERFLLAQGRGKFVKPLYRELMTAEWGREHARRLYARARPTYHAAVTAALDGLVVG